VYRSGGAGAYGDCDLALAVVVGLIKAEWYFDASWQPLAAFVDRDAPYAGAAVRGLWPRAGHSLPKPAADQRCKAHNA
jgi:hypothetical protein